MSNSIRQSNSITEYESFTISELKREELGVKSFQEISSKLAEIKEMIDEMISIAETNTTIPSGLVEQIYGYANSFSEQAKEIKAYNIDNDQSNFQNRNRIINRVLQWYNSLLLGYDVANNNRAYNFLPLYSFFKNYTLLSLQKDKTELDALKKNVGDTNSKAIELLGLLQAKASGESVQDYAAIFQKEASIHSNIHISFKPFKIKFGSAQIWLLLSIFLIVCFGFLIAKVNSILPIDFEKSNTSIITLELLTRLVVISFAIYLISFSFKQYNVQKHLHTLNKHRENTLNSFKLFIESVDASDTATRNALMLEVAKAIYESGQSGYISSKDSGDSSPSIIEMTRFVNQSK